MASIRITAIRAAQDGLGGLEVDADVIGADGLALPLYQKTFQVPADVAQQIMATPTVEEGLALLPGIAAQLDPAYGAEAILAAEQTVLAARQLVSGFLSAITLPLDIAVVTP